MTDAIEHLKWLPIRENNVVSILKLVFLTLSDTNWPKYLPIETVKNRQSLRTENTMKVTRGKANCFSNQALVLDKLPKSSVLCCVLGQPSIIPSKKKKNSTIPCIAIFKIYKNF